jgi:hypothetical protein
VTFARVFWVPLQRIFYSRISFHRCHDFDRDNGFPDTNSCKNKTMGGKIRPPIVFHLPQQNCLTISILSPIVYAILALASLSSPLIHQGSGSMENLFNLISEQISLILFLYGLALLVNGFKGIFRGEIKVGIFVLRAQLSGSAAWVFGTLHALLGAGMLVFAAGSFLKLGISKEWAFWAFVVGFCATMLINATGLVVALILNRRR